MHVANLELCKELYELSGWEYYDDHRFIERVWERSYSTSEMGMGNSDYATTLLKDRNKVHIGEWRVTDNYRNFVTTGQGVFKWWYSEVQKLHEESLPAYDLGYLQRRLRYYAEQYNGEGLSDISMSLTPENDYCKLAIELLKKGILKPEGSDA